MVGQSKIKFNDLPGVKYMQRGQDGGVRHKVREPIDSLMSLPAHYACQYPVTKLAQAEAILNSSSCCTVNFFDHLSEGN